MDIYDSMIVYIYILYTLFFQWFGPWLRLVMSWLQCCYACDEVPGRCMWKSPHHTEMGSSFTQLFEGLRDHWSWGSDSSDKGCTHPSGTIHPLFCRWMFQLLFICCKAIDEELFKLDDVKVWDTYYMNICQKILLNMYQNIHDFTLQLLLLQYDGLSITTAEAPGLDAALTLVPWNEKGLT